MNSCLIFSGVDNCFLGCLDHLPLALCLSILLFAGLALRIISRVHQTCHQLHHGSIYSEIFGAAQSSWSSKMGSNWIMLLILRI
ncbi:hypothetical protein S245_006033 [Arachis hypogaea]